MGIVVKVRKLREQLNDIADYIAADSPTAAIKWLADIEATFGLLSTQPFMGQVVHTKRMGKLHRHSFGKYSIYYKPIPGGVAIMRVFHGARDQDRLV